MSTGISQGAQHLGGVTPGSTTGYEDPSPARNAAITAA